MLPPSFFEQIGDPEVEATLVAFGSPLPRTTTVTCLFVVDIVPHDLRQRFENRSIARNCLVSIAQAFEPGRWTLLLSGYFMFPWK